MSTLVRLAMALSYPSVPFQSRAETLIMRRRHETESIPLTEYRYSEFRNIPSVAGEVALCLDLSEWNSEY